MENAALDSNSRQTMTARLNTDGSVMKVRSRIKSVGIGYLMVSDNTTGTAATSNFAATDSNARPTLFAVSSVDGVTPVPLLVDSTGALLINSN